MCNRGISFWLLPQSVLLLPLEELLSEVCTCRSFVLLRARNHGLRGAPKLWVNRVPERALSSGYSAVGPRVLFKELFAPGVFRVPLVPPPLSVCSGSRGCRRFRGDRVSPSRSAALPTCPAGLVTAGLIPAPAQVCNGLSSLRN